MKVEIPLTGMVEVLKMVAPFAGSEPPIMACVRMSTDEDKRALVLTCGNLQCTAIAPVLGARIEKPGSAFINANDLRRWLMACPSSHHPLVIDVGDKTAKLSHGKATCTMPVMDGAAYSTVESKHEGFVEIVLHGSDFIRAVKSVVFAMDRDDKNIKRTDAVLLAIDPGTVNFMATDGKAMSLYQLPCVPCGASHMELIPCDSMRQLPALVEGGGDVTIRLSKWDVVVETVVIKFTSRLLSSAMYPWRGVLKMCEQPVPRIGLPVKELLAAVRQVAAADPSERRMDVAFQPGAVVLKTKLSEAMIDVPLCDHDMEFPADWEYLRDILAAAAAQDMPVSLEWGMNQNFVLFRAGKDWLYTFVPLITMESGK